MMILAVIKVQPRTLHQLLPLLLQPARVALLLQLIALQLRLALLLLLLKHSSAWCL
jgi:hypothetical protein